MSTAAEPIVHTFLTEPHARLGIGPHARTAAGPSGVVVMDIAAGKYFALNPTGAEIWSQLERGAGAADVIAALERRFDVDPTRLRADLARWLDELARRALVVSVAGDPARTGDATTAPPARASARPTHASAPAPRCPRPAPAARGEAAPSARQVMLAWTALVAADATIKLLGFARFYRFMRAARGPAPGSAASDREGVVATTRAAVDRAARLYFKRAWCLQRSAVTACLLRARGVPAELVVGVKARPFLAHAWVEVEGRVVNDAPSVARFYQEIERC